MDFNYNEIMSMPAGLYASKDVFLHTTQEFCLSFVHFLYFKFVIYSFYNQIWNTNIYISESNVWYVCMYFTVNIIL